MVISGNGVLWGSGTGKRIYSYPVYLEYIHVLCKETKTKIVVLKKNIGFLR